jgi:hypothetical protein
MAPVALWFGGLDESAMRRLPPAIPTSLVVSETGPLSVCQPLLADGSFGRRAAARSATCPPGAIKISSR